MRAILSIDCKSGVIRRYVRLAHDGQKKFKSHDLQFQPWPATSDPVLTVNALIHNPYTFIQAELGTTL